MVRYRLTAVKAQTGNLIAILKHAGQEGFVSVKEELGKLETDRAHLEGQLQQLEEEGKGLTAVADVARTFIESWKTVAQLFEDAESDDKRVLLQHHLEVVEWTPTGTAGKVGTYALRFFPQSTERDDEGPNDHPGGGGGPPTKGTEPEDSGSVLTVPDAVRRVDETAPRSQPSS